MIRLEITLNVKQIFTSYGKESFTLFGKQFFTLPGKVNIPHDNDHLHRAD